MEESLNCVVRPYLKIYILKVYIIGRGDGSVGTVLCFVNIRTWVKFPEFMFFLKGAVAYDHNSVLGRKRQADLLGYKANQSTLTSMDGT